MLPSPAVPFQQRRKGRVADLVNNCGRQGSGAPLWIVGSSGCLAVRRGTLKAATFISNGGLTTATMVSTPTSYQDEEARLGWKERCFDASSRPSSLPFILPGR